MIKGVSKAIKTDTKDQKIRIISMLLGKLVATLIGNLLTGEKVEVKIPRRGVVRPGEGAMRAGHDF